MRSIHPERRLHEERRALLHRIADYNRVLAAHAESAAVARRQLADLTREHQVLTRRAQLHRDSGDHASATQVTQRLTHLANDLLIRHQNLATATEAWHQLRAAREATLTAARDRLANLQSDLHAQHLEHALDALLAPLSAAKRGSPPHIDQSARLPIGSEDA